MRVRWLKMRCGVGWWVARSSPRLQGRCCETSAIEWSDLYMCGRERKLGEGVYSKRAIRITPDSAHLNLFSLTYRPRPLPAGKTPPVGRRKLAALRACAAAIAA